MTFKKFENDSFCVGGRHRSRTLKIYGDKASEGNKVLIGFCSKCNRTKRMTVSDITKKAEDLGGFFKNLGKIELTYQK